MNRDSVLPLNDHGGTITVNGEEPASIARPNTSGQALAAFLGVSWQSKGGKLNHHPHTISKLQSQTIMLKDRNSLLAKRIGDKPVLENSSCSPDMSESP